MEVFLHNLPAPLADEGLKKQLEPHLKKLGIVDFLCEKPKKKNFGNITFLHREDGQRFLQHHGEEVIPSTMTARGRPRLKSKLQLMGTDVFCKPSKNAPHEFALRSLRHNAEQRGRDRLQKYEDEKHVSVRILSFACGYSEFTDQKMWFMPEVNWLDKGVMRFKKRSIIVKLDTNYTIRIPISTVVELVWSRNGDMLLTLSTVPYFFSRDDTDTITSQFLGLTIKVAKNATMVPSQSRKCSLGEEHAETVGQCLVYKFMTSPIDLLAAIQDLKEWEIPIVHHDIGWLPVGDASKLSSQMKNLMEELATYTRKRSLPFGILYQLQALAYNAYLPPYTVRGLARKLCQLMKAEGKCITVLAMKKMFDMIDWPSPHGNPADFEVDSLMELLKENEKEIRQDLLQTGHILGPTRNLAQIHKVMVTPTRVSLHGPELEPKNRILRRFPNHHDYFIRVQFCDESGQDLHFNSHVSHNDVFARFKSVLTQGIQIAGRRYSFLGWSHSSLRSHAVWFSAPFVDDNGEFQTHFSIIKALGDFSKIQSPARCAARIGQAFTETPFSINLTSSSIDVEEIPDVTSKDGMRVFSDGVGTLSWDVAAFIWDNIPREKGYPTCFQVRMGGAKGMLAVDSRLEGTQILIRPSMVKFQGDMNDLEICDMAAKPIRLVLNRQMIKIMEDMGVSENWFFDLQTTALKELRLITSNAHNTEAFIKRQMICESIGLFRLFRYCYLLPLDFKKEPFLRSLVEAVVLKELRLLKHKARIPVRQGITLFGIMDETGFLETGQVYITYNPMHGRHALPPEAGKVLVTRSPALHGGDIQFAENVIPPDDHPLAELQNCIVFSSKGDRDLPSQLSGGDLDGDIFNIIWDPEAHPLRTFDPADYPRVTPVDIGRPVERNDMAEFFVDFMRTDHLGVIAIKHMILADQEDDGISHPDCQKLAQLHSTAVDFSKTGIPVQLNEIPRSNNFRPDFLAPGPQAYIHNKSEILLDQYIVQSAYDEDDDVEPIRKYYRSEKILGKLYRAIDERKIWFDDVHSKVKPDEDGFWNEFLWSSLERCEKFAPMSWERCLDEGRRIRLAYEEAIFSTRNEYSTHPVDPISELEVVIGSIMSNTGVQTRRQRDQSTKLADEFDRIATWIMGQLRKKGAGVSSETGQPVSFDSLELCFASIHVGGETNQDSTRRRRIEYGELKSFRIIAACALLFELDLLEKRRKRAELHGRSFDKK
ncbi:rna-dependent rna polymerase [Aspergillus ellipticus CBS 707.79]|uniref:RNA-dependent RNA polymerase n=1 Tax=Aspergillus ellipticus CBS 707.79 TaxID=1448320 RepID=A0A319DDE2_9EURO|nr:rna-dependent rna polymerase [Aspergillus ellipticus CBS 707.79]